MIVRHCDAEPELAGSQVSFYVVLKSALSVLTRERHMRGSGGSLEPPGPLPMHLHTVHTEDSECLPTLFEPPTREELFVPGARAW